MLLKVPDTSGEQARVVDVLRFPTEPADAHEFLSIMILGLISMQQAMALTILKILSTMALMLRSRTNGVQGHDQRSASARGPW